MGIRVNKMIGYGLSDLKIDQYGSLVDDDRFNDDSFFTIDYKERKERYNVTNLIAQLSLVSSTESSERDSLMGLRLLIQELRVGKINEEDFYKIMNWDSEYGMPNVAIFTPFGYDNWRQYDGMVDYYEETINHQQTSHFQKIDRPLYPFEVYMDMRTMPPTRCNTKVYDALRAINSDTGVYNDENTLPLVQYAGFDSIDEFKTNVAPMIPKELYEVIRFLRVFKDPNTIYELRPMIYTCWV